MEGRGQRSHRLWKGGGQKKSKKWVEEDVRDLSTSSDVYNWREKELTKGKKGASSNWEKNGSVGWGGPAFQNRGEKE